MHVRIANREDPVQIASMCLHCLSRSFLAGTVNVLKFWTLAAGQKVMINSADPDQTASEKVGS